MIELLRPAQYAFVVRNPQAHVAFLWGFGKFECGHDLAEVSEHVDRKSVV